MQKLCQLNQIIYLVLSKTILSKPSDLFERQAWQRSSSLDNSTWLHLWRHFYLSSSVYFGCGVQYIPILIVILLTSCTNPLQMVAYWSYSWSQLFIKFFYWKNLTNFLLWKICWNAMHGIGDPYYAPVLPYNF